MTDKTTNAYIRTSKGNNDECYTHRYAVEPLLEYLECFRNKIIWCSFDKEESEYVKVFSENGFKAVYSHIDYGQDFYSYEPESWDILITNPPFSNKTEMFKRVISFKKPFAILMSILYLNDGIAAKVFKDIDLQILSFDKRMKFKNQPVDKRILLLKFFTQRFMPKFKNIFFILEKSKPTKFIQNKGYIKCPIKPNKEIFENMINILDNYIQRRKKINLSC